MDRVTGKTWKTYESCNRQRKDGDCKEDAILFEPRPVTEIEKIVDAPFKFKKSGIPYIIGIITIIAVLDVYWIFHKHDVRNIPAPFSTNSVQQLEK